MYDFEMVSPRAHRRDYYHGQRRDGIVTAIVLCYSTDHARMVSKAFPIPGALYVPMWSSLAGIRAEKIIVFREDIPPDQRAKLADAVNAHRTKLLPGNHDEVYYV